MGGAGARAEMVKILHAKNIHMVGFRIIYFYKVGLFGEPPMTGSGRSKVAKGIIDLGTAGDWHLEYVYAQHIEFSLLKC